MKILVDRFCSLATSPSWQAWLFHFNKQLHRKFIKKLQGAKGCNQNKDLMIHLLEEIELLDGSGKLEEFLSKHYPNMIEGRRTPVDETPDAVFPNYNPHLLTYPRRIIFTGDKKTLHNKVQEFVLDKIRHDSIIVGNKAYIEYLTKADSGIVEQIPDKNWLIGRYRLQQ